VSLTPDSVYARDKSLGGFGQDLSYKSSSMDTTDNILKYRFKHMFKADIEFKIYRFSLGVSNKYYSKMQNIDKAFKDIEVLTDGFYPNIDRIKGVKYWKTHLYVSVWDARVSYKISEKQKLSLVCNNVLNEEYSLRPLKIESQRNTALQYALTF
jgi:iron complex outermembrane receptor protein